jgi:leader peptidase (prepilin peptidase)/N-methyltransferase
LTWFLPLLAAPFVGSTLGVLIRRLPQRRPVGLARSVCEHCGEPLAVLDLLPIAAFLALRGRCRYCGEPIARFHIAIELAALGVAGWATMAASDPARLWAGCVLGWLLLALAWTDAEHLLLPDALTLPLLLLGLAATWALDPQHLTAHALGAAAGYLAFSSLAWLYAKLRRRDGLGLGDAKLLAAAGAWLGWAALPMVVVAAALGALALAGVRAVAEGGVRPGAALAFGPFLAAALWLMWLYGRT